MKDKRVSVLNRRGFIRQAACAALGTGALSAAIGAGTTGCLMFDFFSI